MLFYFAVSACVLKEDIGVMYGHFSLGLEVNYGFHIILEFVGVALSLIFLVSPPTASVWFYMMGCCREHHWSTPCTYYVTATYATAVCVGVLCVWVWMLLSFSLWVGVGVLCVFGCRCSSFSLWVGVGVLWVSGCGCSFLSVCGWVWVLLKPFFPHTLYIAFSS